MQALAEQRRGGETGVRPCSVCLAMPSGRRSTERRVDSDLFFAALTRASGFEDGRKLDRTAVSEPKLLIVQHNDGLLVSLFELNGAVGTWSAAWRDGEGRSILSTQFWTQEARPAGHFGLLVEGIQQMIFSGIPSWPVERTLLTSGTLDALLLSHTQGGAMVETPELRVEYQPTWRWRKPPPPPPSRPWSEQ